MTYLGPLRLHFAGQFQAAVSTLNNDPENFDRAQSGPIPPADASWNPHGDGDWRLIGCRVTAAWHGDGKAAAADDPVLGCLVADADMRAPAKLVDLDSQQQTVSTIFGLQVRICGSDGGTLLRSEFEPAAFTDLWTRVQHGRGDASFGASYQSVLTDLEWSEAAQASKFLAELRERAPDLLSIKFNVDGYQDDSSSPEFTRGRIVGTIGPATVAEPRHLVAGRHLLRPSNPFSGNGSMNYAVARAEPASSKLYLDLGNALATSAVGGALLDIGPLAVSGADVDLGTVTPGAAGWYERTAGIVALPADRWLTKSELDELATAPLHLTPTDPDFGIAEAADGLHVRADMFVFRLEPGEAADIRVLATRFGAPCVGASVQLRHDASALQGGDGLPAVGVPEAAVDVSAVGVTGADGTASIPVPVTDPGNPRKFIDGQVYAVRPALVAPASDGPVNPWDFVSLLVHDEFKADDPPTWYGSLLPIFRQYANLYPVMQRFLRLDDYESVCANRELLRFAFALPIEDPNQMPVTRDLSRSKRAAILRWLDRLGPDGLPLRGTPAEDPGAALADARPHTPDPRLEGLPRGGKTAALARRSGAAHAPRT